MWTEGNLSKFVRSSPTSLIRSCKVSIKTTQIESQTSNTLHHPTIIGAGEEISFQAIPYHLGKGWVLQVKLLLLLAISLVSINNSID